MIRLNFEVLESGPLGIVVNRQPQQYQFFPNQVKTVSATKLN